MSPRRLSPETLELPPGQLAGLPAVLAELAAAAGGAWVNLDPEADVEPEALPRPRGFLVDKLGARGPEVPRVTWSAPTKRAPINLGVHHAGGVKAARRLAEVGIGRLPPSGGRVVQDHPKRGLVVAVPTAADEAGHAADLRWLQSAATYLSTVPLSGWWLASVFRP